MKSFQSHYEGYAWIKVPRYQDNPNLSWEERYQRLEKHHLAETVFLIEEVRKLAKMLDEARSQAANQTENPP